MPYVIYSNNIKNFWQDTLEFKEHCDILRSSLVQDVAAKFRIKVRLVKENFRITWRGASVSYEALVILVIVEIVVNMKMKFIQDFLFKLFVKKSETQLTLYKTTVWSISF